MSEAVLGPKSAKYRVFCGYTWKTPVYLENTWVSCRFPQFCPRFCPRPALRLRETREFPEGNSRETEWSTKHPLVSLETSGNAKCWGPSGFPLGCRKPSERPSSFSPILAAIFMPPRGRPTLVVLWAEHSFPENKKENRGSPALCVSGNFQGKQRVFGAPFWKLASFPESESWSGAKSEAKLRKSARYPGGRRVFSRYTRGFPGIPAFRRFG